MATTAVRLQLIEPSQRPFLPAVHWKKYRKDQSVPRSSLASFLVETSSLAFVPPPACFDQECQAAKDSVYILSLVVPLLAFGGFAVYLLSAKNEGTVSLDSQGYIEKSYEVSMDDEERLARDAKGEIAYRVVRYTPYLTERTSEDECVRLSVGPVGQTVPQSYLFELSSPSCKLVTLTLPKPLGIVFEEDKRTNKVHIVELVENSEADRLRKRAMLDSSLELSSPQVGDVLRAMTTTVVTYKEGALIAQGPEREIVVFGADGQKFRDVRAAMKRGLVADGPVTLVLERHG